MYFNVFARFFVKLCRIVCVDPGTRDRYKSCGQQADHLNMVMKDSEITPVPATIRLPDGRTYTTADLMRQVGTRSVTNLRTGRINRGGRPNLRKYTLEEREWQVTATIAEIQARYGIKEMAARSVQWRARQIVAQFGMSNPGST